MINDPVAWVVSISTIVMILNFLVGLYVKQYILPVVEDQLKNCKVVADARAWWGTTGLYGKSYRYAMVNLALTSTKRLSEKGLVDMNEINQVSLSHRRWICIPMRVFCASMAISMLGSALMGRLW